METFQIPKNTFMTFTLVIKIRYFCVQNYYFKHSINYITIYIYPTPPIGQDMKQGQFLSEV